MKEVIIETSIKTTKYQAIDGTQFLSKEECRKYEESAKCVLLTKYRPMVLNSVTENELFKGAGSEEYSMDIVKIDNEQNIDTILQLYILYHPKEYYNHQYDSIREKITNAFASGDLLFIGRDSCGDDIFSVDFSKDEMISNIYKYCNETN
jgi:hypothetical protein